MKVVIHEAIQFTNTIIDHTPKKLLVLYERQQIHCQFFPLLPDF